MGTFDWEKQEVRDQQPLPEDILLQNENLNDIFKALDKCTLDQRSVIILRFIQGYSISETAQALQFSESKVKTTQHRGLKVLRKQMELLKEDQRNEEVRMERRTAKDVTKPTSNS